MIPRAKYRQFGRPKMTPEGIVIHNTNSPKTARELAKWMKQTDEARGCHYFVDSEETIQMMPLTWSVFNTGMGNDFGNTKCIAIEICTHPSERKYLEGQARAIKLIKDLMAKYHLKESNIYFHRDFNPSVNCPAQILRLYGNKQNFLQLLKGEPNGQTDA